MKVVFYSPFANIWEHSFPESLIAEGLVKQGVEVTVINCGTMLDLHCVAMSATGVTSTDSAAKKKQVCAACTKRRDLLAREMPFDTTVMDDRIEPSDRAAAQSAVDAATLDSWPDVMVDGVPLGRYAAYEFLLNYKLVGTTIPAELFGLYLNQLRMAVIVYFVSKRILAELAPDRVVVFNRLYSVNHAFCAAAERAGIPTYTLQGGGHITRRGETMTIYRDTSTLADVFHSTAWKVYSKRPIGAEEVALVGEHFSGLLEGSSAFAYSSAFEAADPGVLRDRLGIAAGKPVLLVPMSSEDEINAARLADALPESSGQGSLFDGQFDWIRFLLDYARQNEDRHIVIRLHPRMFPNKRDNVRSPIVDELMRLLADPPSNLTLNLPTDDISLYDLMQVVDVVLSYRSSVGIELAAFGIPVVVPSNADFFTYPEEINLVGHTQLEYAQMIDRAISEGWSIENTRRAFRWFAFLFSRIAVDFSDSVSARPIAIRPKKPGFRLWLWRKAVYVFIQFGPLVRERIALRNRRFPVSSQQLFVDVLANDRLNLADSTQWNPVVSTVAQETRLLDDYLASLASTLWKDISTPDSLTTRIRGRAR